MKSLDRSRPSGQDCRPADSTGTLRRTSARLACLLFLTAPLAVRAQETAVTEAVTEDAVPVEAMASVELALEPVDVPAGSDPQLIQFLEAGQQALRMHSYATAQQWLWIAAQGGNAAAQNLLGVVYQEGLGTEPDVVAAADWFRPAALQGDVQAQNRLAILFRDGRGVENDDPEAAWWFQRAAEQGHAEAQANLGVMYIEGRGVPQDELVGAQWLLQAAEQGDAAGQYELGVSLAQGRGIARDSGAARNWLQLSAAQAYRPAQEYLRTYGVVDHIASSDVR